jgi:hypothetical protein
VCHSEFQGRCEEVKVWKKLQEVSERGRTNRYTFGGKSPLCACAFYSIQQSSFTHTLFVDYIYCIYSILLCESTASDLFQAFICEVQESLIASKSEI